MWNEFQAIETKIQGQATIPKMPIEDEVLELRKKVDEMTDLLKLLGSEGYNRKTGVRKILGNKRERIRKVLGK